MDVAPLSPLYDSDNQDAQGPETPSTQNLETETERVARIDRIATSLELNFCSLEEKFYKDSVVFAEECHRFAIAAWEFLAEVPESEVSGCQFGGGSVDNIKKRCWQIEDTLECLTDLWVSALGENAPSLSQPRKKTVSGEEALLAAKF